MNPIEQMAEALELVLTDVEWFDNSPTQRVIVKALTSYKAERGERDSIIESLESEIHRLESEKSHLADTLSHEAEMAMSVEIEGKPDSPVYKLLDYESEQCKYTRVITERLRIGTDCAECFLHPRDCDNCDYAPYRGGNWEKPIDEKLCKALQFAYLIGAVGED